MTFYLVTNNSEDKLKIIRPADKATLRMRRRDTIRTDWYPEEAKIDSRFYVREIPEEVISANEITTITEEITEEVRKRVEKLKAERIAEQEKKIKLEVKKKTTNKKEVD